jgi:beta-glucosidase-like glycosyl hydrolase
VTCWPSALTVVQTWDRQAMYEFGQGMGVEQAIKVLNHFIGFRCKPQLP